ncbi:MAG: hypothetical protein KatS3mg050_3806 [Litorilinea sp.]|nr:MAG: hypothetical protein KatS3mg050_3806 [Litorilinea sp.]
MAAFLLLALVHGLLYSLLNPPWFAPDEPSHFEYARLLYEQGRVPVAADISAPLQQEILASMYTFDFWRLNGMETPAHAPVAFGWGLSGDWEGIPPTFVVDGQFLWYFPQVGNEPPLYYVWAWPAFIATLSQGSILWQHYGVRWLSLLLYVACVGLALEGARLLFQHDSDIWWAVAALVLFQPMLTYMGTAINNDVAAVLVATAWFVVAARLWVQGWHRQRGVLLLILTLGAIWVKKTSLFLIPLWVVAVALGYGGRRYRSLPWRWVGGLAILLGIGGLLLAWLPVSNQARFWMTRPEPGVPVRTAARVYEGDFAFQVSGSAQGADFGIVQRLPNELVARLRGKQVVLQAQVSGEGSGAPGQLELVTNRERLAHDFVATSEWTPVSLIATVPEDAQYVRVLLRPSPEAEAGILYFDDISLSLADPGAPNLLANGSGELPASGLRTVVVVVAHWLGLDGYVTPWFMQPIRVVDGALLAQGGDFLFRTFWGRFGSLNVVMPAWWEATWGYGMILALLGMAVRFIRRPSETVETARYRRDSYLNFLAVGIALAVLLVSLPLLNRPDPNWLPQGRFLLPVVFPVAVLTPWAWTALLPVRLRPWLSAILFVGFMFMDGIALVQLVQHSYCG